MPKITLKNTLAVVLVLAVCVAIFYLSWGLIVDKSPLTLRVAVNSTAVATAPLFVAANGENGTFGQKDFTYIEVPFPSGLDALRALTAGKVDVATVAETPVVAASVARPDLRIIGTIARSRLRVVGRRSAGITTPADLKGKRIASLAGSSAEFYAWALLESAGIKPTEVSMPTMEPHEMLAALGQQNVDAISMWEPHAQRTVDALGRDAVTFDSEPLYTEHFNIVTTRRVLDNRHKRAAISRLLEALVAATENMYADPGAAQELVAARLALSPRELERVWNRFSFGVSLDVNGLSQTMANVERWDALKRKRQPRSVDELRQLMNSAFVDDLK